MKKSIVVPLLLFALLPVACSSPARPAPFPTATLPLPTEAPTRAPTDTPFPFTDTPAVASEWNGIPIMPGAVAGGGDEESYVFTIQATLPQIREYYELELGTRGWQSQVEEGDTTLILTFNRDAVVMLTVNVIARGEECLVLLVK